MILKTKKKIIFFIVGILLVTVLEIFVPSTFATKDTTFFYTNKEEISQGEILEMTLDISKVEQDLFDFKLSSNLDMSNITISENLEADSYNNDILISIDKSKNNFDKITFCYTVPENSEVGTKIELNAQIVTEEPKEDAELETEYKVVESKKINVRIVKKGEAVDKSKQENVSKPQVHNEHENVTAFEKNDKQDVSIYTSENENIPEGFTNDVSRNKNKSMSSNKAQNVSYVVNSMDVSSMPSQTETAVYNGSNNNYLESLEIDGEELNTSFNKENTTYFVQTTGKTELNVNATAEDDESKIYVTGNDNLKNGENKILISVTAKNGDVRYYRVFVTNN